MHASFNPETHYYYDWRGRLIGTEDARGHFNTREYAFGEAVATEYHADGFNVEQGYDAFGNRVTMLEEAALDQYGAVSESTWSGYAYDELGRMTEYRKGADEGSAKLLSGIEYDEIGQRISLTRYLDDGADAGTEDDELTEAYRYDDRGRVTQYSSFAGYDTVYSYDYDNSIAGNTGGWRVKTLDELGNFTEDDIDHYGRIQRHRIHRDATSEDLYYTYTYNNAGRLVSEKQDGFDASGIGQYITYEYYGNGLLKAMHNLSFDAANDAAGQSHSFYEYDGNGNRVLESYTYVNANGETLYSQVTTAQYDALNRVTYSEDPEQFRIWYRYDEVGNRRQVYGQYRNLEDSNLWEAQSFWYAFDAMNRFTVTQGSLAWTGTEYLIVRGGTGTEIAYNGLGQRVESINSLYSEQYSYDDFGYLTETIISSGWTATRTNDRQGRTLDYQEENAAGKVKNHSVYTHDGDNRVLTEKTYDDGSTDSSKRIQTTTNTYDAAGNQVESEVDYRFNSINTITTTTEYQYWGAGNYKQTEVTIAGATAYWPDYRWQPGTAVYHYDVNGHLRQVEDEQGGRVVDFVNNAQGQILRREESKYDSSFTISSYGTLQYTEKANLFYLNGIVIGEVNTTGPSRQDYGSQIASSQQAGRDAKNLTKLNSSGNYGYSTLPDFIRPVMFADLDQNYQPIGRDYPSKVPGAYTVQGGETLADVARSVWGDSSLWYLIAEANGLKGSETLLQGTVLKLPNVVTNVHNNADTFRPYEPGRVIGNVAPTLPDAPMQAPEKPDDSGNLIKQIIVVIVVVVVTYFTAGAASGWAASLASSWGGGTVATVAANVVAYGAAAGIVNTAAQLTSMAVGLQDSFNWTQLAQSAVVGGLTFGLSEGGFYQVSDSVVLNAAVEAVSNNVIAQGINMALGQQDTFSWRSVASSAIGGAITGAALGTSTGRNLLDGSWLDNQIGRALISSTISHGVNSAIYGTPFDYAGLATEVIAAGVKSGIASMAQSSQSKPQTVTTNSKEQSDLADAKAGVDAGKAGAPVAQHMQQRETSTAAEQEVDKTYKQVQQSGQPVTGSNIYKDGTGREQVREVVLITAPAPGKTGSTRNFFMDSGIAMFRDAQGRLVGAQNSSMQAMQDAYGMAVAQQQQAQLQAQQKAAMARATAEAAREFDDTYGWNGRYTSHGVEWSAAEIAGGAMMSSANSNRMDRQVPELIAAQAEAAGSMLYNLGVTAVSGYVGITQGVDAMTQFQQDYMYLPQSETANAILGTMGHAVESVMDPARQWMGDAGYAIADTLGASNELKAAIAAGFYTAPDAALIFLAPQARGAFTSMARDVAATSRLGLSMTGNAVRTVGAEAGAILSEMAVGPGGRIAAQVGAIGDPAVVVQRMGQGGRIGADSNALPSTWQQHEVAVTQALRGQNPNTPIGRQVTLDVTDSSGVTVTTRIDNLVPQNNGIYQMVDAKFSSVKDLSLPTTNLRSTATPNQQTVYGWLADGQQVTVVPRGANARAMGLTPGVPIQVNPAVQVHVNSPAGTVVRNY